MSLTTCADLFYLPNLEFFVALLGQNELYLDLNGRYEKQSFRNRTTILLANKVETLSVPVHGGGGSRPFKDIKIDFNQKWRNVHLRGIQSAYGKAPYFEYYFPYIKDVYDRNAEFLVDLNQELLTVCLKLLGMKIILKELDHQDLQHNVVDIRGILNSKKDFGTRDLYQPQPYPQLFGVDFVPNLCILDLLFCMGPESQDVLLKSQKKSLNKV
jgi:hypothetical protein